MEERMVQAGVKYVFEPTSGCQIHTAGKYTPEEIISSVKLGLYAKSRW